MPCNPGNLRGGALLSLILIFSFLIFPYINKIQAATGEVVSGNTVAFKGSSYTQVSNGDDLVDSSGSVNSTVLQALYNALTGKTSATLDTDVAGLFSTYTGTQYGSSVVTATNIRTTTGGKTVLLTFGDLEWEVTSLTKVTTASSDGSDKVGDIVATLWLSNNCQESFGTTSSNLGDFYGYYKGSGHTYAGLYSDWAYNWNSATINTQPSNKYGTSYIRVVTLNAGGKYATSNSALSSTQSQSSSNIFAKFTMSGVTGSLTEYLATPYNIAYQKTESQVQTLGTDIIASYNFPNDAYGTPASGSFYINSYGSFDYSSLTDYSAWQNDYLWLPSITETGYNSDGQGIWALNSSERTTYDATSTTSSFSTKVGSNSGQDTSTYAYSWLRSGGYFNARISYSLLPSGSSRSSYAENFCQAVRPALHLNLTSVAASATKTLDEASIEGLSSNGYSYTGSAIEPLGMDGVTVVLENESLSEGTDYTVSYENNIDVKRKDDDPSGEVEAYAQIILTGAGEYAGSKKIVYFTIVPKNFADMTFGFSFANKTYTGGEQDAGEKVVETG